MLAPDFIGFSKSDKFTEESEYSYYLHYNTLVSFFEELDLNNVTLVVQNWGGILGLPYAVSNIQGESKDLLSWTRVLVR